MRYWAYFAAKLAVAAASLFFMSKGSAQQDTVGDFGLAVQQDNLDSFWLDNRNWAWYGYRSYIKAPSRFAPSLPCGGSALPHPLKFGLPIVTHSGARMR